MCHALLQDARLWKFLVQVDAELAAGVRAGGCGVCGAPLHQANYPRKPRGGPSDLPSQYALRFSFTCSADSCRRRATPQSVRFLARWVYLKVVVILVTAMRQGPTPPGLEELKRLFGLERRTLSRWQKWWEEIFPRTQFWRGARARFQPPLCDQRLPGELLSAFEVRGSLERLVALLRFVSPITLKAGLLLHPS